MSKTAAYTKPADKREAPRPNASTAKAHESFGDHASIQGETVRLAPDVPLSLVRAVVDSPGQPLDPTTREFVDSRFGYDFSRVRVHADGKAAESARVVGADAYTVGNHIAFATGRYAPGSPDGMHTLGHELTHVVQQSLSMSPLPNDDLSGLNRIPASHTSEQIAGRVADSVGFGFPDLGSDPVREITPLREQGPSLQRQAQGSNAAAQKQTTGQSSAGPQSPSQGSQQMEAAEVWERVEGRVISELEIKFVEIGRVAGLNSKRQIRELFEPYEDSLKATRLFLDIAGVVTGGAGNAPSDLPSWQRVPNPQPGTSQGPIPASFSATGLSGGVFSQVASVLMSRLLNTDRVGEVKENLNIEIDELLARVLTTDSAIFDQFQQGAVTETAHEFYEWWATEGHQDHVSARIAEYIWPEQVRKKYSVSSPSTRYILDYVHDMVAERLAEIKKELDKLEKTHRGRRLWVGATGGAIAGGLIGGAVGLGLGGGTGALIGLAAGGAGGALLGLGGGWLTNRLSPTAGERRSRKEREDSQ